MDAFVNSWAPVAQWPEQYRITANQARATLAAGGIRRQFQEWRQRYEQTHTGVRGRQVDRGTVLHMFHGRKQEFAEDAQPEVWTQQVMVARLLYRLYRFSVEDPDGAFYQRDVPEDLVVNAFFDLFLEVKKVYAPTKRVKSAIFATIFPDVEPGKAENADADVGPDAWQDKVVGWPDAKVDFSGLEDENLEEDPEGLNDDDFASNNGEQNQAQIDDRGNAVAPETKVHQLDDQEIILRDRLTSYPHASKRDKLADDIHACLQPAKPFDCSLGLPSIWSEGVSFSKACSTLGIKKTAPFVLSGTPPMATLHGYQVQGAAHVKLSLLASQRAALLDWPGFGKTRQTLLGVERALQSPSTGRINRPSLIVVPSGAVGEHWIREGLACTTTLSFVAVGEGFGREQEGRHRVKYWKLSEFEKRGVDHDKLTFFVCTYGTMRKMVTFDFAETAFHAIIIDEMQVLRKWKGSATFNAVDSLSPVWRVGLTATPLMNGNKDIKGFLAFFRDKTLDKDTVLARLAENGNPFDKKDKLAASGLMPEAWERYVDSASVYAQAEALNKVAQSMKFVISRNLSSQDGSTGKKIGANVPPLLISRRTVGFHDETNKAAFAARFNRVLDALWDETNGRKMMRLDKLVDLATMTLSPFAVDIPPDQNRIKELNAEHANLSTLCASVLGRPVSPHEALEVVRSPKLEWLASFLGWVVVSRREKVVLFVLNNREQLLVRAFVETIGIETATFHSGLTPRERNIMISAFNRAGGPSVFIATWDMGSVGFNLQNSCCIAVALSLYYNQNAEVQGRCRVHRAGQKRTVLYIQCRQAPSLDTIFMLKHSDRKELAQLYARLDLAKYNQDVLDRVLEAVIEATNGTAEGKQTQDAVKSDFEGDMEMPQKCIELLQSIFARDMEPYCKNLERM
ncbi:P-loop containing nucleoside triphosphate hydrolase protein [Phyllosticta citrichinensis]|uniref:P-loop containing nucleoside triphosphate hydrolase protein n=1 Tax=Phyllosticta citrichinensis TaxID=1130410 RepID=A0ABR1XV37_9PEZI